MSQNVSRLSEVHYGAESSFGENVTTYTNRLPYISYDLRTTQERIRGGTVMSRENDEDLSHLGPRAAEVVTTHYWVGHMAATTGALSETWQQEILRRGLGGGDVTQDGGTVAAGASATSIPTSGATMVRGAIILVGSKGDARADGAPAAISSISGGTTAALLTAVSGTANNGDILQVAQIAHRDETATLGSIRMMVGIPSTPTAGMQYHLHGGRLAGIELNIPVEGGLPTISFTHRFAYWQRSAVTIPSSSPTLGNHYCRAVGGGSLFRNDVGTATRATVSATSLRAVLEMELLPENGPGGVFDFQNIVGWTLARCRPVITIQEPWVVARETRFNLANQSYIYDHLLFGATHSNATGGYCVGFYCPRAHLVGQSSSPVTVINGMAYQETTYIARDGTDTTTELTKSPIRFFAA